MMCFLSFSWRKIKHPEQFWEIKNFTAKPVFTPFPKIPPAKISDSPSGMSLIFAGFTGAGFYVLQVVVLSRRGGVDCG
ncbi:MAG: hypothetical protein LBR88_08845 [Zoogloeaceae bacterium]|jgi:hypothetical protein|nr:hypothetical protein [Zoogloeaceae bacterium]